MATYKEIKGVTIQTLDEDPVLGGVAGGSWSSGGNLNTARDLLGSGGRSSNSCFSFWWSDPIQVQQHVIQNNMMDLVGLKLKI